MTTTHTSGAVDLPEALRRSTAADGKTELFNLPGYPLMVRAVDFNRIHTESEMRRTALLDEMQKAALAAGQATKAAPTRTALPEGWTDCTIEFGNDGPEVVAYGPKRMMNRLAKWLGKYFAQVIADAAPKAAPGVGNSVFDHQTAADFLSGKTVSDEAVRKFVAASRWAHDERAALSATLLAMHGVLTSREAEIALLKKALLD